MPQTEQVILNDPRDWRIWYDSIKTTAREYGVLEHVDVDAPQPTPLQRPVFPCVQDVNRVATSVTQLKSEEYNELQYLERRYKDQVEIWKEKKRALVAIQEYINSSVSSKLREFLVDVESVYARVAELKSRVAPTDAARRQELIRQYRNLLKPPRSNHMDWLSQWERLSTEAIKLNLLDVQGSQPLYDFLSAVKSLDESWAAAQQALLDPVVEANGQLPSLKTMIERYTNNIRFSKAISKQGTHSAFVSLRGETPEEIKDSRLSSARQSSPSGQSGPSKSNNRQSQRNIERPCICGEKHRFKHCPYIVESKRAKDWSPDKSIQETFEEKASNNKNLARTLEYIKKQNQPKNVYTTESSVDDTTGEYHAYSVMSSLSASSNRPSNAWIVDPGADIHVCNDPAKFNFERHAAGEKVAAGKDMYSATAFGTVDINVACPSGTTRIRLLNVMLVPGFLANIIYWDNMFTKGVDWDMRGNRLHITGQTLCHVNRLGKLWALMDVPLSRRSTGGHPVVSLSPPCQSSASSMSLLGLGSIHRETTANLLLQPVLRTKQLLFPLPPNLL
jgi:hypothetical protein